MWRSTRNKATIRRIRNFQQNYLALDLLKAIFYYTIWIGVVSGVVNKTKAWLQLLSQYFVTSSSVWQKSLFPDSNIRTENISTTSYDSYVMQHNLCDNFWIDGHNKACVLQLQIDQSEYLHSFSSPSWLLHESFKQISFYGTSLQLKLHSNIAFMTSQ